MTSTTSTWRYLLVSILALLAASCATTNEQPKGDTSKDQQRHALLDLRDKTVAEWIVSKPAVRDEIASAVGYGVFASTQYNVVLLVMGDGAGVLTDNKTGKPTYMKMVRVGRGAGVGDKGFRQLLVFKNRDLFDTFRAVGADVTASGDATFKPATGKGLLLDGNVSLNPMLSIYQMTDTGVVLQANRGGVAYLPDAELNR
ncbi:hypothetical protein [Accumulibacter sp.]|uniref:hypothetical protein n=1 Tax=Accumulibacter sp. TaxID=2053492 RepID=UPI0028C3F9B2|nr:hypothetical protein [Accumulibacter sp.]